VVPLPAAGYNVYLKAGAGKFQKLNASPITDTFVRLVDLVNGMPYVFAVTAVGENGAESAATPTPQMIPRGTATARSGERGKGAGTTSFSPRRTSMNKIAQGYFLLPPPYGKPVARVFDG